MRTSLLVFFILSSILPAQKKDPKPPELQIVQATVRRSNDQLLSADGTVKNTGTKPLTKLLLVLEFFAPGKQSIVIQKGEIEAGALAPGESSDFICSFEPLPAPYT